MDSKKVNIILSVIVFVLISAVAYMYFDAKSQSYKANQAKSDRNRMELDKMFAQPNKDTVEEKKIEGIIYTNEKFGFTLNLPQRWSAYSVVESNDELGYHYYFELPLKQGGKGKPFLISVLTHKAWNDFQNGEFNPYSYITKNEQYVFVYDMGHDDEGYVGFPEIVPSEKYQGPFYDVANEIIPTFKFIESQVNVSNKDYTNQTYNYSFAYPAQYDLKSDSDRGQYLVDQATFSVILPEKEDANISFADFMFKRVKLLCDADGVTASITCSKYATQPEAFKTSSGLNAYKLTFVEQTTKYSGGKSTVSTKNKTIYVVDLGSAKQKLALAIVPLNENLALVKDIVLSVSKLK